MLSDSGERSPFLRRLASAASLIALVSASTVSAAPVGLEDPEVLKSEPYYLGLYETETARRGTVLTIHGGGWRGDLGPAADEAMSDYIDAMRKLGYDVANLGYRSGADSLPDAIAAFDLLRERLGPEEPICIFGGSAGAQLALIVAARRGDSVDCVVDLAGPPDLVHWGSRPNADDGKGLAVDAFGEDRLAELSPINNVEDISAPVLVIAAACDVFIEVADQRRFVRALNAAGGDARLQVVEPGDDVDLVHCAVSAASFEEMSLATTRFLAEAMPAPAVVERDEDDGSGLGVPEVLVGVVVLAGVALLVWVVRR